MSSTYTSSTYDSDDEEWDLQEEEEVTMLLAVRANKRPRHGSSVLGRERLWRERRAERVVRFIASYHSIRRAEDHDELQTDVMEEWWRWNGEQNH